MHQFICGYITEFSLRWSALTENPYKNKIKAGSNQLFGASMSTPQAMFWKKYRHNFLSQSWVTRHLVTHDIRFLSPAAQEMFFHLSYYVRDGN